MLDYIILGEITASEALSDYDEDIFENFFDEYLVINHNFKMFEDCKGALENSSRYRYDGTEDLDSLFIPSVNTWYFMEDDGQCFLNCDFSDNNEFPISTLHYLYKNFLQARNIDIEGDIVAIDFMNNEVLVYNVKNSNFQKHINKTENYTKFWNQCFLKNFDEQSQEVLIRYYTLEELLRLTPIEIFEDTYTNFEY